LKGLDKKWEGAFYKLPEVLELKRENEILGLSPDELRASYLELLDRNKKKTNQTAVKMSTIVQNEKVSIRSKMRDIIRKLFSKAYFGFSELFSLASNTKAEVVTGFLAVLELSKLKKIKIEQKQHFSDIIIYRTEEETDNTDDKQAEHNGIA
jgi:segregation and condensation protein A